jgi:hypothetical protein
MRSGEELIAINRNCVHTILLQHVSALADSSYTTV